LVTVVTSLLGVKVKLNFSPKTNLFLLVVVDVDKGKKQKTRKHQKWSASSTPSSPRTRPRVSFEIMKKICCH
jgi:hypothetical protein